jgi:hypothetical protein
MPTTRKQTAIVTFPWSNLAFLTIEARPIHKPIIKNDHDEVQIKTEDGTIFNWDAKGDVTRTLPSGEYTRWRPIPTVADIVSGSAKGISSRFYSDGRVIVSSVSANQLNWYYGPPEEGTPVEGSIRLKSCKTCIICGEYGPFGERDDNYEY